MNLCMNYALLVNALGQNLIYIFLVNYCILLGRECMYITLKNASCPLSGYYCNQFNRKVCLCKPFNFKRCHRPQPYIEKKYPYSIPYLIPQLNAKISLYVIVFLRAVFGIFLNIERDYIYLEFLSEVYNLTIRLQICYLVRFQLVTTQTSSMLWVSWCQSRMSKCFRAMSNKTLKLKFCSSATLLIISNTVINRYLIFSLS